MTQYQCPDCGYVYDENTGNPHEGFPAGTTWDKIPEDWACPDCSVRDKVDFLQVQPNGSSKESSRPSLASTTAPSAAALKSQKSTKETKTAPTKKKKNRSRDKPQPSKASRSTGTSNNSKPFKKWVCITCGHIYDEALGDETEGFPPGTRFEDIPDDWCCPDCGATKEDYVLFED